MLELKIGSRVKVTDEYSEFYGFVGKIIEMNKEKDNYRVKFNNGQQDYFNEKDLQKVEASMDTLLVGDIIVSKGGGEAKIMEVGANTFLRSRSDFNVIGCLQTFYIAKKLGYKIKGQKKVEQMTVAQISKELGREIEVVEE